MNSIYPAKTYLLGLIITLFITTNTFAQVGINTTSPSNGSMLDVTSTEKGMLVPRVDISDLATIAPITGGSTESLLVYNTNATTGEGFYYWNSTRWVGIDGDKDWRLDGNSGTDEDVDFVGTTDGEALTFRTNDTERFRVANGDQVQAMGDGSIIAPFYSWADDPTMGFYKSGTRQMSMSINGDQFFNANANEPTVEWTFNPGGDDINLRVETDGDANTLFVDGNYDNVGVGTNTPTSDVKLEVNGGANNAIFGYSDNVGGYLGRESDITFGTPSQTILGAGVYANNPFAGYTSMFAQSTGAATVAASAQYSDVWIANYSYVESNRELYNPPATYAQLNINNSATVGVKAGIRSYTSRGTLADNGGASITTGVQATAIAENEEVHGMYASIFSEYGKNSDGIFTSGFIGYNVDYSSSTIRGFSMLSAYYLNTDFKVLGTGAVSTIIEDTNDTSRIMFAPEAPEVLFQDFGVGKLVNGNAFIAIDPILAKNIAVDSNHPLKVYITLEGECNGIYVTNKSINGFTVKELKGGNSNVDFSWQIVASRKDRKGSNKMEDSKFQDLRFPIIKDEFMERKIDRNSVSANSLNK